MAKFRAFTPPRDQLSPEWLACVEKLEAAIGIQSLALQTSELVFIEARELLLDGKHKQAATLLENGENEIAELLKPKLMN